MRHIAPRATDRPAPPEGVGVLCAAMTSHHDAPQAIATDYLTALCAGDFDRLAVVDGNSAFFEGAAGLLPVVHGHRMRRLCAEREDVCSVCDVAFETARGSGLVLMTESRVARAGNSSKGASCSTAPSSARRQGAPNGAAC
jgi:hypothetical protein